MSKITTTLEKITPAVAKAMLRNNPKNRLLKPRLVEQLASDIKSGEFHVTHQGIAFDEKDNLIDGQHRLSAVVAADKAVDMYVTRGLHPDMMNVVDIGAKRTQADVLRMQGYHSSPCLSAAAQIYYAYVHRKFSFSDKKGRYINNFTLTSFVKAHPDLIKAVEWTQNHNRLKDFGRPSVVAAFYAIFHKKNKAKANEFFRVLIDNHSEKKYHPAVILYEHILRRKANRIETDRRYTMAAFIISWGNFVTGNFQSTFEIKDPNKVIKEFK